MSYSNAKPQPFRGKIYQNRSFDLCAKCPAHCCTGKGKFGFASVHLEEHEASNPLFTGIVERHPDGSAYLAMGDTCRFLGYNNRCTIYADRPEACRNTVCLDYADGPFSHRSNLVNYEPWQKLLKDEGYAEPASIPWEDRLQLTRKGKGVRQQIEGQIKLRLLRVGRGQFSFICRFVWHGEQVTAAINKLPMALHGALAVEAKRHRMAVFLENGVMRLVTPWTWDARNRVDYRSLAAMPVADVADVAEAEPTT